MITALASIIIAVSISITSFVQTLTLSGFKIIQCCGSTCVQDHKQEEHVPTPPQIDYCDWIKKKATLITNAIKMPPKAKNRDTLTALKKRASVVNASFRKEISSKKKECVENAKRARQVLLIKVPKTSAGSVEQRKTMLRNAINSRSRPINVPQNAINFRLARARQKEKENIETQRRLDARLRHLRALKKARDAGAGAGASLN